MKTVFVICELNPFHAGHRYLMETVRTHFPGCLLVCLMSGNFVQRGSPAAADRWTRARMALEGGADVVLELPFLFAVQGAARFAAGAVRIAEAFGADYLAFGAESEDAVLLHRAAAFAKSETAGFSAAVRRASKRGANAGGARQQAFAELAPQLAPVFDGPNNILAVEYLRALSSLSSQIRPFIIHRGPGPSAHRIRENLAAAPDEMARAAVLKDAGVPFSFQPLDLHGMLYRNAVSRLRLASAADLQDIAEISAPCASRIMKAAGEPDLEAFLAAAQTRWLTRARLRRCLLNVCLGVTKETVTEVFSPDSPLHARLLGLRALRRHAYGEKKKHGALTVVSSYAQYPGTSLAQFDIRAVQFFSALKTPMEDPRGDQAHRVILL